MVLDHLQEGLREEKEPLNLFLEDLQRKMRLMNQRLLEEAKKRKNYENGYENLSDEVGRLEAELRDKKNGYDRAEQKFERVLGRLENLGNGYKCRGRITITKCSTGE